MGFQGTRRPDGKAGVRNHVLVLSSVSCANGVVNAIGRSLPGVKAVTHTEGCGRGLADVALSTRTLIGLGSNPNVAGVLLVGLGCEVIRVSDLAAAIAATGKPVECLVIQEQGGSQSTTRKGIEIARRLLEHADSLKREECGWDELILAVECGGSDAMSGVTANPLVGATADWLCGQGGTVILSETTEMIGTDHILARRAATPEVADKIKSLIRKQEGLADVHLGPFKTIAISPGNMDGGLTNIVEKSIGCIIKGGTSTIQEVVDYAERPKRKGLIIMDTPGSDIFSVTAMVAAGAQIVLFTTGRGSPVGFPIAPVIKIATNTRLFSSMREDMDFNAGRILEGVGLSTAARELNELLARVAAGEQTRAEANQQDILSLHTVGPAF